VISFPNSPSKLFSIDSRENRQGLYELSDSKNYVGFCRTPLGNISGLDPDPGTGKCFKYCKMPQHICTVYCTVDNCFLRCFLFRNKLYILKFNNNILSEILDKKKSF
jgi:hypothetical protein